MQVRAELFDWTSHACRGDYDVVLACDVLYEHFSVEPVANIAPQLLSPKGGVLLLADPSRRTRENRYIAALGAHDCCLLLCTVVAVVTVIVAVSVSVSCMAVLQCMAPIFSFSGETVICIHQQSLKRVLAKVW